MAHIDAFAKATQQFHTMMEAIGKRKFLPVYILSGEECYFAEEFIKAIIANALTPDERDFNQTILYGTDSRTTADGIVSLCRRYPMFAERQLIIVKECQALKNLDNLAAYIKTPFEQTLLVLAYSKDMDKRTSFGKIAKSLPGFFESTPLKEGYAPHWIMEHCRLNGITIEPDAAQLLGDSIGTGLQKIVLELDKLVKSLSDGATIITVKDVEENTGLSREFSAFELCRAIGARDAAKAYKIAHYMGESPKKYPLQMTLGALYFYFSKALKGYGYCVKERLSHNIGLQKAGVYPGQMEEYSRILRNYNLQQVMKIIARIRECDYKSKSNSRGNSSDGELLQDFITGCLH